jgi:hypothetical protein
MIFNRDGQPSADLSVIWGVWIRDNRRKRNAWRFVEAHPTRDLAFAHHCAGSLGIHSGVESADAAGVLMGCLLFFDVFAQDVDGRTTAA